MCFAIPCTGCWRYRNVPRSRPRSKRRCVDCRTRRCDGLPISAGRHSGQSLKETIEIARIAKAKTIGNLLHRKLGVLQPEPGLFQKTVMDQLQRRAARAPAASVVEMRARDPE